ncbi:selenocysteine-specific translation elongation factor [Citricoccus sp.]|uniref:selenocysteine-specific translation elongation factor n=1 Tax=Citricoccus sp. TaxID=1978372 RepID=UPI0028BF4C19|nr:selenocysteine-specific translation elongation factor [Citricoccus sp.]
MYVVATAGHVDHGKSTLVRALTGMEPDRWAEEKRRGLTIDLGFAWTTLPSGEDVAFVDVPGHERFLGNMLAGLGPAPAVCFIVAADEGWQAQSADHRDAIAALGIEHGLIVITKADRAAERVDSVLAQTRAELAGTSLAGAPAVVVSALSGAGLEELRRQLGRVLADLPAPAMAGRVRFWVDRSFTVKGAGAVVTGTLTAGTLAENERLEVLGADSPRAVSVRALHSRNRPHASIGPTQRVAVNLRGTTAEEVHRGDALVTPGAWPVAGAVDIRRTTGTDLTEAPGRLLVHVGTATVPARVRPFNARHARLTFERTLPLVPGDRLVLRDPGSRAVFGGARVLDVDPPVLTRRGAGTRHTAYLETVPDGGDARLEVMRRGAVRRAFLQRLGLVPPEARPTQEGTPGERTTRQGGIPADVRVYGDWWVHAPVVDRWAVRLREAVEALADSDPLAAGLSRGAAAAQLDADGDGNLLDAVIAEAGLEHRDGYVCRPGLRAGLGPAEQAIAALERRLAARPFDAPEGHDLTALNLGAKELAAAERAGRLLRLDGSVVLLPTAPVLAMRELARLDQPFTTSQARQALGTSRRVAIPVLEHLDSRGWTRRVDGQYREVVR